MAQIRSIQALRAIAALLVTLGHLEHEAASLPAAATGYAPILRAVQATNPDIIFIASYPQDSVGMVRAANEIGLKVPMFGGGLIGLQFAPIKAQLGQLLNGIVAYELYVPEPTMNFPGIEDFLTRYAPIANRFRQQQRTAGSTDRIR